MHIWATSLRIALLVAVSVEDSAECLLFFKEIVKTAASTSLISKARFLINIVDSAKEAVFSLF